MNLPISTLSRPSLPLAQPFPSFSLPALAEDAQDICRSLGTFEILGNPSKDPFLRNCWCLPSVTCHGVVCDLAKVRRGDTRGGILLDQAPPSLQQALVEML